MSIEIEAKEFRIIETAYRTFWIEEAAKYDNPYDAPKEIRDILSSPMDDPIVVMQIHAWWELSGKDWWYGRGGERIPSLDKLDNAISDMVRARG